MTQQTQEVILSIDKLGKNFGGVLALEDFSLDVREGDLHCLIGPNGAGKTTVFKIIIGAHPPTSGRVIFKGKDITRFPAYKVARMGVSVKMQVPGIYMNLALRENIRIALRNHCRRHELSAEIDRLVELLNLTELGNPLAKNMSHGQQQWLEIAMCLACKPKLLLLDEPVAGMGMEETEITANLVTRLNESGLTILFIEHDMNFVRRIARQVTVLHQGRKFKEGTMNEIESDKDVIDVYLGKS